MKKYVKKNLFTMLSSWDISKNFWGAQTGPSTHALSVKPLKNCLHSLLQQLYIYFLGFYPILFFRSMPLSVLLFCLWISAKSVCHNLGRTVCLQSPRLDSRQFPLDLYSKLLQWEDILELANLYSLVQFLRPPKRPHFPSQQGQQADSRVAF